MSIRRLWRWLTDFRPVRLAVVRKYRDANGYNVGELYLYDPGQNAYLMVGASLDTWPLDVAVVDEPAMDTERSFLDPMPPLTLRVGSQTPSMNELVKSTFRHTPRRNMSVAVQNRFVEHILEGQRKI